MLAQTVHSQQLLVMEVGVVNINHTITRVTLSDTFKEPVIIAQPASFNGGQEVAVRLQQIDSTGFDIYLDEPLNRDNWHLVEEVHYIAVEKGSYLFNDGTVLEAGTVSATGFGFQTIGLSGTYAAPPAIMTQVQTTNSNTRYLHTRQRNATTTNFEARLEREESQATNAPTTPELVGYFAISKGSGVLDGVIYEAGSFVTDESNFNQNFGVPFTDDLHYISSIATFNDAEPVTPRWRILDSTFVRSFVQEDISSDNETNHADETLDYFAIDDNQGQTIYLDRPLPIELLSFDAQVDDRAEVDLKWITTTAIVSGDRFRVERSQDGRNWKDLLGVSEPNRRTDDRVFFTSRDFDPPAGIAYYRLRQIEVTGRESFSPVRQVNVRPQLPELQLYPTPSSGQLTVEGIPTGFDPIVIVDLTGRNLSPRVPLARATDNCIQADVSELKSGIYFLLVGDLTLKFVKN
ncbi:MAG: T9SS type A sorting domain-containing protein [Bacteroidota bacterium]